VPYHCSKCGQIKKNHRCTAIKEEGKDAGDGKEGTGTLVVVNEKKKPERVGWTRTEDAIITQSVEELGHRWFHIADRLPGRTDHAIRNRWHRLQSMRHDAQQVGGGSGQDGSQPAVADDAADPIPVAPPVYPQILNVASAAPPPAVPIAPFSHENLSHSEQGALIADCLEALPAIPALPMDRSLPYGLAPHS